MGASNANLPPKIFISDRMSDRFCLVVTHPSGRGGEGAEMPTQYPRGISSPTLKGSTGPPDTGGARAEDHGVPGGGPGGRGRGLPRRRLPLLHRHGPSQRGGGADEALYVYVSMCRMIPPTVHIHKFSSSFKFGNIVI